MRLWFNSKLEKTPEPAKKRVERKLEVHRSLALNILFHQFRESQHYRILDLGRAFGQNVDFFSQFSCKLHIEDLYDSLSSFDYFSPSDGFSYETVYSYLLPFFKNAPFDIILAWDLFNHLDRNEFKHLILHLGQYSKKGTMLFTLISMEKHIPEKPVQFKIVDEEHLLYLTDPGVMKKCPKWEKSDLDHLMPNFRVCNSFLLRNGFKEYLFLYE
ncbi:MAG: methyltransferase domain-containing protein [Acidobacteriota bacterium]|nr:MAG: methyltransferase domain-containing protein [Acidobacteriota bacterium]